MDNNVNYYSTKKHLFYISPEILEKDTLTLSNAESLHAINALRYKEGQGFEVFDGAGNTYLAEITQIKKGTVSFKLIEHLTSEIDDSSDIIICSAIKLENLEIIVEKLTELNIRKLYITQTKRSQLSLDYIDAKLDKLRTISINACKQSKRLHVMKIETVEFSKLNSHSDIQHSQRFYAGISSSNKCIDINTKLPGQELSCVIGPEGGFTDEEELTLSNEGFKPISIAKKILRAETACIVVATMMKYSKALEDL